VEKGKHRPALRQGSSCPQVRIESGIRQNEAAVPKRDETGRLRGNQYIVYLSQNRGNPISVSTKTIERGTGRVVTMERRGDPLLT